MTDSTERIDHPEHYRAGGIEAIDAIRAWGLGFNTGNVVKYIARAGRKRTEGRSEAECRLEDLKKAKWYLDDEIAHIIKTNHIEDDETDDLK